MTCGICNPKSMAPHYNVDGVTSIVYGYAACSDNMTGDVAYLYHMGAAHVFWDDTPTTGQNVFHRPGLKVLRKVMRRGDVLLVNHDSAFGDRPTRIEAIVQQFENDGISLFVSTRHADFLRDVAI